MISSISSSNVFNQALSRNVNSHVKNGTSEEANESSAEKMREAGMQQKAAGSSKDAGFTNSSPIQGVTGNIVDIRV